MKNGPSEVHLPNVCHVKESFCFQHVKGSFMLPLRTKTDPYVLNNITVTALILPCVPYVGMDVTQYIQ